MVKEKLMDLVEKFRGTYKNALPVWTWCADVHVVCEFSDNSGCGVYLRGHVEKSTEERAAVSASMVNYESARRLWAQGEPLENGGEAVVRRLIEPSSPVLVEYDVGKLADLLARRSRNLHTVV